MLMHQLPGLRASFVASALILALGQAASAQQASNALTVTQGDKSAGAAATQQSGFFLRMLPNKFHPERKGEGQVLHRFQGKGSAGTKTAPATPPLSYWGGQTIYAATEIPLYLNCPANNESCWGKPAEFEADLQSSTLIHVADQYIKPASGGVYAPTSSFYHGSSSTNLAYADILSWVHALAVASGGTAVNSHSRIYHVFLNKGTETCYDSKDCYSPTRPAVFTFCAYHASHNFSDVGLVRFTVEPYQNVTGCQVNNSLTDSTDNVLSHEIFETITDPDGTAWYDSAGEEIGDKCAWTTVGRVLLNKNYYNIQKEWSNKSGACSTTP